MKWINIKEKRSILKFLLKTFFFLATLFVFDYSIGSLLKYLYFKQNSGPLYEITYSVDSTKADLIIFGSSTSHHDYPPSPFQNRLGMSYYNTSNDGTSILYHYAILRSILKRYSPKIVILGFDIGEFKADQKSYDRLSALLPYYDKHLELRSIIELRSKFEKIKLLSKIYPFNSTVYSVFIRNPYFAEYNLERKVDDNGYLPLNRFNNNPMETDVPDLNFDPDSTKIDFFKSFIKDCQLSNVDLYIIISPRFIKYPAKDPSVELAKKISDKYNVPFYDYSSDSLFLKHHEYFADRVHLNDNGAKVFSNIIVDKILQNEQKSSILKKLTWSADSVKK